MGKCKHARNWKPFSKSWNYFSCNVSSLQSLIMSPTNFSNIQTFQTCDDPTNTHFLQVPNYTTVYEFERSFDYPRWKTVMGEYWHWSIYASLIYGCLILWGQKFMKTRSPFKLKYPLIVWNVTLTLVSGAMMWRLFPELWFVLTNFSIVDSVCNR
jgi:hypothetical protein